MKKPTKQFTGEGLKAPAGFEITIGHDNGPYIFLTRKTTKSRGVHHPDPAAKTEEIQAALRALAERVVQADARAEQRRAERDAERAETEKGRS